MIARVVRHAAAAALILAGTACGSAKIGALDRVDVAVEIQPNGTADVEETLVAGARTPSGALLTRVIAPPESDGVQLVSTAIDGVFRAGPQDGVTVDGRGASMTVRWRVPAGSPTSHTLTLRYRAFAAVRVQDPRGFLSWPAIAARRGFDIGASELRLTLPPGVSFYEGTGIAEAGWSVARAPRGIVATHAALPDGQRATLLGEFDIDTARVAEAQWQVDEDRQLNLLPSYVTGAIFMFVVAGAALFLLRRQYVTAASGDRLVSDPQLHAERLMIGRGLRVTALVGTVLAVIFSVFCQLVLPRLGPWIQLVPASMVICAVWFVIAARRWDRDMRA